MIDVLQELAEYSRRQILAELRSGPKRVSDLVQATGLKQPNVSNHLARMRLKGVLEASKVGREVFYALATPEIHEAVTSALAARASHPIDGCMDTLIRKYADASIEGDESTCASIIDTLARKDVSLLAMYVDILTPAMKLVGDRYSAGQIDEAQEHLASGITERMMSRTIHATCANKRTARTAVLGCCPNNWHTLGARMVSDFLKFAGWKVYFLGANVPIDSFVQMVAKTDPDLALVSISLDSSVADALQLVRELEALAKSGLGFSIGVGGRIAEGRQQELLAAGADFVAEDLRSFAEVYLPEIEAKPERSSAASKYLH